MSELPSTTPFPIVLYISTSSSFDGKYQSLKPFISASKAYAYLQRRNYVIPEDIKYLAFDILRHRLNITFAAEAESMTADKIISAILGNIEVP